MGGRVFVHSGGRRRWAPSVDHLADYGLRLESTLQVEPEELFRIPKAGNLPRIWPPSAAISPPNDDPWTLREIACSRLKGSGVEFGAGTNPLPMPLDCEVRYADFIPDELLQQRAYAAQGADFVRLDLVSDIERMEGIADESLDFAAACHVIEHVPNPLGALQTAFRKLRPEGHLLLVVPDMNRTFDRPRLLTTLEHLILDFEDPNRERDLRHYLEWSTKVLPVPLETLYSTVLEHHRVRHDIHYHTWTYESFGETIEWAAKHLIPSQISWSHPTSRQPEANEFYFVLKRLPAK